jgi:hypothetical protein
MDPNSNGQTIILSKYSSIKKKGCFYFQTSNFVSSLLQAEALEIPPCETEYFVRRSFRAQIFVLLFILSTVALCSVVTVEREILLGE